MFAFRAKHQMLRLILMTALGWNRTLSRPQQGAKNGRLCRSALPYGDQPLRPDKNLRQNQSGCDRFLPLVLRSWTEADVQDAVAVQLPLLPKLSAGKLLSGVAAEVLLSNQIGSNDFCVDIRGESFDSGFCVIRKC